jgi:hypothetical protein
LQKHLFPSLIDNEKINSEHQFEGDFSSPETQHRMPAGRGALGMQMLVTAGLTPRGALEAIRRMTMS